MKKLTINKCNWSGESAVLSLYADGSFLVPGIGKFRLVLVSEDWCGKSWDVVGDKSSDWPGLKMFSVHASEWHGVMEYYSGGPVERESGIGPEVVAAQVLYNIC